MKERRIGDGVENGELGSFRPWAPSQQNANQPIGSSDKRRLTTVEPPKCTIVAALDP